jgi:triacylglycerol esterase/lipase EstA (alpha/beta hydrolase family)
MWTALTLASLVVAGTAAYAAWALNAVAQGAVLWPFVVGIPFAFLAVPLLLTIFWFTVAWWFRAERPPNIRLSLRQRVAMFGQEFLALARSIPRMIFFRWLMPAPPRAPAALPIVLLHGVGCNAGVWSGFRRHLDERGIHPVYALSYAPPLSSIELFADQLAKLIATIEAETGARQIILIGHSMGGLVARAYLRRHGAARVRRLVTVGTPHHGSMHAWLMSGTSLSQMRPGNPWLAQLNRDTEADCVAGNAAPATVSIWSWHDSMVSPQTSSRIDWGDNVVLTGIAHNALLDHPEVWANVLAQIAATAAATSGSPA